MGGTLLYTVGPTGEQLVTVQHSAINYGGGGGGSLLLHTILILIMGMDLVTAHHSTTNNREELVTGYHLAVNNPLEKAFPVTFSAPLKRQNQKGKSNLKT